MKLFSFIILSSLLSCNFAKFKPVKSGNDNSHLQNPVTVLPLRTPDSLNIKGQYVYRLTEDLRINNQLILDSFILEKSIQLIGKPDSIHFGGPLIVEEFGADDYNLFFGKSLINAGHGQIMYLKILDQSLRINSVGVGSTRNRLNAGLSFKFPIKDTVVCLGIADDFYYFIFNDQNTLNSIEYYAPTL